MLTSSKRLAVAAVLSLIASVASAQQPVSVISMPSISGTVAISGSVTTSPPSNASTNVTQWAGVGVTLNKGASDTGTLRVTLGDGAQAIGSLAANQTVNLAQVAGTTTTVNKGASDAGTLRVTLGDGAQIIGALTANQSTNIAQLAGTATTVNKGASDAGTLRVSLGDGAQTIGNLTANQSVNVTQVNGAALASPDASSYLITVGGSASATATLASVACNILTTASTNATSCKGSAGNFYGYEIYNTTTTVYYLRLYNTAAAPTCSSATGFIRSIPIPPAAAAGLVGGAISNQAVPVNYGTGIGYCVTAGSTSTDNTNAAAGIFGEIRYK